MRKICSLILAMLFCSLSFASNFRSASWGDSIEKIKRQEKGKAFIERTVVDKKIIKDNSYEWETNLYSFKENIAQLGEFDVSYTLLKNRLISGEYSQDIKGGDDKTFNRLKEILTQKYGAATYSNKNTSYIKSKGRAQINYERSSTWVLDDTIILLNSLDNRKLQLEYRANSKEMLQFIEKNGLNNSNKKKKKWKKQNKHLMEKF
jgi:hypothetical protein